MSILLIKISNILFPHGPKIFNIIIFWFGYYLADTFYSPKQKAGSPSREQKSKIYVQGKAIKASPKKRKRCAASVEQIFCQAHYLFWAIILITYETEQYGKWPQLCTTYA